MTGKGTVLSVSGKYAIVKITKKSACSHDCDNCRSCTAPTYETKVFNGIGASKGDDVLIYSDTSKILFLSFLVYIIPVLLIIFASVLCDAYSLGLYSLCVFAFMILVWILVIKKADKKIKMQNAIVEIIGKNF